MVKTCPAPITTLPAPATAATVSDQPRFKVPPARTVTAPASAKTSLAVVVTEPALTVKPASNVFAPERLNTPAPSFTRPYAPLIIPPTLRVSAVTVTVRFPVRVTAPLPVSRELLPRKVRFVAQTCGLFVERVTALPEVLSITPPRIVKLPVPRAAALFNHNPPSASVNPPLNPLVPERASTPAPAFVNA